MPDSSPEQSKKGGAEVVGIEVRLKDLPIDKKSREVEQYRTTQLPLDRGILERLVRQEVREREVKPDFKLNWDDLQPGERARLWALAAMADEEALTERELEVLNRIVPDKIPMKGQQFEEFLRGLHGTGLVTQEEAVRAYLERLKRPA